MSQPRHAWRVTRFAAILDPAFDDRLRSEPDIALDVAPMPRSEAEVDAALRSAHVYHVQSARNETPACAFVSEDLLRRHPGLLLVSSYGAGFDPVDVAACSRAGVAVVNQAGANRDSVAEHAVGLMLDVVHRLTESDRRLRAERGMTREDLMGRQLAGKRLGIVGIGEIGTRVAQIARALRMEVVAADPFVDDAEVARRGARRVPFEELLETSDVVSLHCPRDATTLNMMAAAQFGRMKKGAVFITTARGGIHDEAALAQALRSGQLGGAGVDVWEPEPPPLDHPLLQLPNVVATYHTAGVTHEARRNIAVMGSAQIIQVLRGEKPPRLVNADVWPAFSARLASARGT